MPAKGLLIRTTGDTIALSPLTAERSHIEEMVSKLSDALLRAA